MRYWWISIWIILSGVEANAQARIESEYKISVPLEEVDAVWNYLQRTFTNNELGIFPAQSTAVTATEKFYDTYFDDNAKSLLKKQAGVRYRQRFVNDSLVKALVQLKVPTMDELGVARKEFKFTTEKQKNINDRSGLHPFLKHLKRKDISEVDVVLGQFGTSAKKMIEAIKLKQIRRRIYISDNAGPLMTFTLDEVSAFHFPYTSFVELELELNEVRYTDADYAEKLSLEKMNTQAKQVLFESFVNLKQDQTPKYNKMHDILAEQPIAWLYNNLMYLFLGLIGLYAITLVVKNEVKFANT